MSRTAVSTGVELQYEITGEGDPLLLVMGTAGSMGLWGELTSRLSEQYQVIAFDNRGLGGSERGDGPLSMGSLAADASALLDALEVPRAHLVGWSLGSAVVQEMALARPDQCATAVLYSTWARCDGFQRAVLTALRYPYTKSDLEAALGVAGIAFSPEALDQPAFPQGDAQMQVVVEQWDADLAHDTVDRLGGISAPTLVLVGEQDLLTPPWQSRKVADAIPGAEYELLVGPGSSHCLHLERPDDVLRTITGFLERHPLRA